MIVIPRKIERSKETCLLIMTQNTLSFHTNSATQKFCSDQAKSQKHHKKASIIRSNAGFYHATLCSLLTYQRGKYTGDNQSDAGCKQTLVTSDETALNATVSRDTARDG